MNHREWYIVMSHLCSKMGDRRAVKANGKQAKHKARVLQRKSTKSVSSSSMSSSSSPLKEKKAKRTKKEARERKASKEDRQRKKATDDEKLEKTRKREEDKEEKDLAGTPLGCVRPPRAAFPQNAHKRLHRQP